MMATRLVALALVVVALGCGRPTDPEGLPEAVMDFHTLYEANCAGCHGVDGRHGAAQPLNDPVYLALVDDTRLRAIISNGVPGTGMSAFAKDAGGTLTTDQIAALVDAMRQQWGNPQRTAGVPLPAYSADDAIAQGTSHGDPGRGRAAYDTYCAQCHGAAGRGGPSAGSVVDPDFLSLTSDQALRTTVIAGRADEGKPGWRDYLPDHPMKPQEISDVVAWLASHRGSHD